MTSAAVPDSLTDYSATIKAEIIAAVKELALKLAWLEQGDWTPTMRIKAQYIQLGYLINTHHGVDLYSEGDIIEGIPVRICRDRPRTLSVCADDASYSAERYEDSEDIKGKVDLIDVHEHMDARASMIW